MAGRDPFASVLEDIDWLWEEWWLGEPDKLSPGELRRGSTTLNRLLVEGVLPAAWRHYGFERQPRIIGPDLAGLAKAGGLRVELAASCVAGGGRQNGLDAAFIGAFRVDNPSTGVRAEAESGFAVLQTSVVRAVSPVAGSSPLDALIERAWYVTEYLESPGAVRKGEIIKRREVIQYFRNYKGGAHVDLLGDNKRRKTDRYELISDLEGHVLADVREGLLFELLSIGQSVARSPDVRALADVMRQPRTKT